MESRKSNVSRLEKATIPTMEPMLDGNYSPSSYEGHLWRCNGCGLVWTRRHEAFECEGRKHAASYAKRYGVRYVLNGEPVGGYEIVYRAVRREGVAHEAV